MPVSHGRQRCQPGATLSAGRVLRRDHLRVSAAGLCRREHSRQRLPYGRMPHLRQVPHDVPGRHPHVVPAPRRRPHRPVRLHQIPQRLQHVPRLLPDPSLPHTRSTSAAGRCSRRGTGGARPRVRPRRCIEACLLAPVQALGRASYLRRPRHEVGCLIAVPAGLRHLGQRLRRGHVLESRVRRPRIEAHPVPDSSRRR